MDLTFIDIAFSGNPDRRGGGTREREFLVGLKARFDAIDGRLDCGFLRDQFTRVVCEFEGGTGRAG
ncbi:MAG: hypothetical protein Fur0032_16410 [Terrimicrobiaceae bacterium]